jgi:monomeric isocitrate dehydrogenase
MLSIVPLMNGGGMFETGAGRISKHVEQFTKKDIYVGILLGVLWH